MQNPELRERNLIWCNWFYYSRINCLKMDHIPVKNALNAQAYKNANSPGVAYCYENMAGYSRDPAAGPSRIGKIKDIGDLAT
jgi:hypothetical protein